MNRFALLSALLLACAPLAPAAPQDAPPKTDPASGQPAQNLSSAPPLIPASELKLHYYTARRDSDPDDLLDALVGLGRRRYYVRNEDGSVTGPVDNVRGFGDSSTLVIYDLPEQIERITAILADLERATSAGATQEEVLQVAEYTPRSVSVNSLCSSLQPFLREIAVPGSHSISNINFVEEPARLVLRDTPENLKQMLACLERVDVAAPQFVVKCWLLGGSEQDTPGDLPPELVDNLRRLVPFGRFQPVSMALLRASLGAGQKQELRGEFQRGSAKERFQLELIPGGFDSRTQALSFERCAFEATTGQQFSTAAVVDLGEYVVLGAAGSDPLFVVLRVTPVQD